MKIAFLHFVYCGNRQEENQQKILQGMKLAASHGAQWVLTPEMALQGYQMIREDFPFQIATLQNGVLEPFQRAAASYKQRLFLGCAYNEKREPHNSIVVLNPDGSYCGQHAKVKVVQWITEKWAHPGEEFAVWNLDGIKTSVMVCADMYFAEYGERIAKEGAELVIGGACWPPGGHSGPPEEAWKRLSKAAGGITVLVSNQTSAANSAMDCSRAQSAVIEQGKLRFTYEGAEAVLLIDFDEQSKRVNSDSFEVHALQQIWAEK